MRCLDLFCGAGGASVGLERAGFEVVGVDIDPRRGKRYPGAFVCGDAMNPPVRIEGFDFVWASPPCQRYTVALIRNEKRSRHPDLVGAVREMLTEAGVPFVIENVPGAPVRADVVLTGAAFGLPIVRRRHFEVHGFPAPLALQTRHLGKTVTNGGLACVAGHGAQRAYGRKWLELPVAVRRAKSRRNSAKGWSDAMGIDWMTNEEMAQAVPPAYSQFIGEAAIEYLKGEQPC